MPIKRDIYGAYHAEQGPELLEQLLGPDLPLISTGAQLAMVGAAAYRASNDRGKR